MSERLQYKECLSLDSTLTPIEHLMVGSTPKIGAKVIDVKEYLIALRQGDPSKNWDFLLTTVVAILEPEILRQDPKLLDKINLGRQKPAKGFLTFFDPDWYINKIALSGSNSFLILPMINEEGRITVPEWFVGFYNDKGIFLPKEIQLSRLEEFFDCEKGSWSFSSNKVPFDGRFGNNLDLLRFSLKGCSYQT